MKRALILSIVFILVFSFASIGLAATNAVKITQNMQIIDTFNDVSAYYRPASVETDARDSTYSCAAFAKRYFSNVYGVSLSGLASAVPNVSKGSLSEVTSPQAGDLAYWSSMPHSAIVKSVSGSTITIIEQNWKYLYHNSWFTQTNRTITKSDSGVKFYRWSGSSAGNSSSSDSSSSDSSAANSSGLDDVVFYEHINGQGWAVSRSADCYVSSVENMGFSNDQLSCIKINSSNITVELYWDSNYQGQCLKFTTMGTYNLTDYNFNDVCSSYKIYQNASDSSTSSTNSNVIFCGDRDGNGWNVSKAAGTNASGASSLGFSNDQLSSIRIPAVSNGKIYVAIYENDNYSGRSYTFSGEGLYNLEPFGFDNICSSYQIWIQ